MLSQYNVLNVCVFCACSLRTPSKRQSSVSSGSVPLTCLRGNHLQQVCESWVNWFQVCTEQPALLREGYAYVVAAIGNFITIQGRVLSVWVNDFDGSVQERRYSSALAL